MSQKTHPEMEIPLNGKIKALPGFFELALEEQAPYEIIKNDNAIEIRAYASQLHATLMTRGNYKEASNEAFNALTGYIFGHNQLNEKIQMTTPVLLRASSLETEWSMSFILPKNFTVKDAPRPVDSRIQINQCPARQVASISYSGINNEEKIEEHVEILKKWLKKRPWYIPLGDFQTAQYDGPLTIPFFRKNEIHIDIKHTH